MRTHKGRFFLVGGGPAARTMGEPFMERFLDTIGATQTKITLITAGTAYPEEVNACYWEIFTSLGIQHIFSPKLLCPEDAQADWLYDRIAECNAVFIAGGSQAQLSERLAGTPVEQGIHAVLEQGGVLAGTSSGSSILAGPMILEGGTADRHLRPSMISVGQGFGFLGDDISVDTHCSSRGRLPRILALMMGHPCVQAIGIDEDTVLLVHEDNIAEVLGYNAVYILDNTTRDVAHEKQLAEDHLCASGIILHCLTEGDRFDLNACRPTNFLPTTNTDE